MRIRREIEPTRREFVNQSNKTAEKEEKVADKNSVAEQTEEQKQIEKGNEEFQNISAEYVKKKYFDSNKTDFNFTQQTQTYYYLNKQNELKPESVKYDDEALKKKELKSLDSLIPSKTLRDDFILGYKNSSHFREIVKQADFYNGTIEASTKGTATNSLYDQKTNKYEGSEIKIIPGATTTTNVGKMSWELTNMKNHQAFDDLEAKARANDKSIDKVGYVKGVIAIEGEAAFNEKLVIMDAHGLYTFKGLEKYDKMNSEEFQKNKSQFIKDYVAASYDNALIEKQGEKTTAKEKYGADYDRFVKEGPIKAPSTIPSGK